MGFPLWTFVSFVLKSLAFGLKSAMMEPEESSHGRE